MMMVLIGLALLKVDNIVIDQKVFLFMIIHTRVERQKQDP
jgi:hypothetical protein